MKKAYETPSLEIVRLVANETITTEDDVWVPTLSPGVENWD
jgi:hypothetical protein